MALCLSNEQMLQLTFPPLFLEGEGVLKTLAYSQQHLLATSKFKQMFFFFFLLCIFLWCLTLLLKIMAHLWCIIQRWFNGKFQSKIVIRQCYCHQLKCICNFQQVSIQNNFMLSHAPWHRSFLTDSYFNTTTIYLELVVMIVWMAMLISGVLGVYRGGP